MGQLLAADVPIFSTLSKLLSGASRRMENSTIFSVIRSEETLEKAIALVHEVVGDMKNPGSGILFVVPVTRIEGLAAPLSAQGVELAGAVSYTHLRAHETNSYLVCRLL